MITVARIVYSEVREQPELLTEYVAECSVAAIGGADPQWETYAAMEEIGLMEVFAVYLDDRMVGFASVLVAVSPHYGVKLANVESLFVTKAWRGTRAGAMLLRRVERFAADAGCKALGRWRNGRSAWKALQPI